MAIGEYCVCVSVRISGHAGTEAYEGVFLLGRLADLATVIEGVDLLALLVRAAKRVEPLADDDFPCSPAEATPTDPLAAETPT
jgi:hypothetical protein